MSRRTQKKVLTQIIAEKVEQSKMPVEPVFKIDPKKEGARPVVVINKVTGKVTAKKARTKSKRK